MIAFIEKITRQIVENQSNINSKKVEDKKSDVQNEDSEMIVSKPIKHSFNTMYIIFIF